MENYFIQMAASAGHRVAHTIGSVFKHINDCVQLYFTNRFTNIVLKSVHCLWLVGVTLIFDGIPQIIVQCCQIAAPRWPNDISSTADNAIFKNRSQNIKCSFGCVARSIDLLKPNVANILLFIFLWIIIRSTWRDNDRHWMLRPLLAHFRRKMAQLWLWTVTRFGCVGFQCMRVGFLCPKCNNFACLHIRQEQNELHLKRWFFFLPKSASFESWSQAHLAKRRSNVYTTIFVRWKR